MGILADTISQQELVHVTEKSQGNDMRPKPSAVRLTTEVNISAMLANLPSRARSPTSPHDPTVLWVTYYIVKDRKVPTKNAKVIGTSERSAVHSLVTSCS